MTIYVTLFDPETKQPTANSEPSGFDTLDDVAAILGEPIVRGKRTLTYAGSFYSNYSVTSFGR